MDLKSYVAMLESYVKVREPDYSKPHKKDGDSGFHHNRNGEKVHWRKDGKIVLFLDMDGVLANWEHGLKDPTTWNPPEMLEKGFFFSRPVNPGAKEFVEWATKHPSIEVYIASKPLSFNVYYSASEKMEWVDHHMPELNDRIVLTCNKGLLLGDVLADDDANMWKDKFKGEFFHFDKTKPAESFKKLREHLEAKVQ